MTKKYYIAEHELKATDWKRFLQIEEEKILKSIDSSGVMTSIYEFWNYGKWSKEIIEDSSKKTKWVDYTEKLRHMKEIDIYSPDYGHYVLYTLPDKSQIVTSRLYGELDSIYFIKRNFIGRSFSNCKKSVDHINKVETEKAIQYNLKNNKDFRKYLQNP